MMKKCIYAFCTNNKNISTDISVQID